MTAHEHRATTPEPPLRVLQLLPDLSIGGGTTIVLHHVRHADRSRFDVLVASLGGSETVRPFFEQAGTVPVTLDLAGDGLAITVARLVRMVRRESIGLLHVHSDTDRKIGEIVGFLTRTPVVSHLHAEWVYLGVHLPDRAGRLRQIKAYLAGWARDWLEHATIAHYVADSTAIVPQFAPHVRRPIAAIRQAVPLDEIDSSRAEDRGPQLRRTLEIAPSAPVLLTVARMVDGKGHEDLVSMLAAIVSRHPDVVLVLVGDGPRRNMIRDAISRAGLAEHVRVLGDRTDVPALLTIGTLFVFASRTESFGIAVLEAMAASLPIVAYQLPAFAEFAVSGSTAELVPIGDVAALTSRVDELLSDPVRATELGREGRRLVEQRCTPASIAESFEAVYEQAVGER